MKLYANYVFCSSSETSSFRMKSIIIRLFSELIYFRSLDAITLLVSPLIMNCQHQTVFVPSSPTASRLSMRWQSYVCTAWVTDHLTDRSALPSYCMHPVLVAWGFPSRMTYIESMVSCVVASTARGCCPPINLFPFEEQCMAADRKLFD